MVHPYPYPAGFHTIFTIFLGKLYAVNLLARCIMCPNLDRVYDARIRLGDVSGGYLTLSPIGRVHFVTQSPTKV